LDFAQLPKGTAAPKLTGSVATHYRIMCRTTRDAKTGNPAKKPGPPKPPAKPRIPKSLQKCLEDAFAGEQGKLEPPTAFKSKDMAITIVMMASDGDHQSAHINGQVMHYSGSLPKVAALYAAHDLRAAARKHAAAGTFTSTAAFISSFNLAIDTTTAVPDLVAFSTGHKPTLTDIFTGFKGSGPDIVEFKNGSATNKKFQNFLDDVDNSPSAGVVIRALGYSYINVSLMNGGFFDRATSKGIWLAGDYSGGTITKTVRVPVVNDIVAGGSGQAMTTEQMARLFRLIHMREGYSHVADATERAAANDGVHNILESHFSFFFDPRPNTDPARLMHLTVPLEFTNANPAAASATHRHCIKVGIGSLGNLKPDGTTDGPSVFSEGAVMAWNTPAEKDAFNTARQRNLTGDFALVWQNMYDFTPKPWDALARLVNTTIKNFLTQP
jgi:hypothetical protein